MKDVVRPVGRALTLLLALAATAAVPAGAGLERTLFKDLAADDPAREIIATVLSSPSLSPRAILPGRVWDDDGFRHAWERARSYFPGRTYFVVPGAHFMTHGFDTDGKLFMEVHESAYLTLCAGNRRTFTAGAIVGEYGRMRGQADPREATDFREKLGRLEPSFRDEDAHRALRKSLGEARHDDNLRALREEDYHMLAGGLLHEGFHAGLDGALVARVRSEYEAGAIPVQWDEARAFLAEIAYHGFQVRRLAADLGAVRDRTAGLMGRLEPLRKRATLGRPADRAAYDALAAGLGAEIALGRLRMREMWQSVRRVEGLLEGLRRDYVRPDAPLEFEEPLTALERNAARCADEAGEDLGASELALRGLETLLGQWDEWAVGTRPFPPPVTDSASATKRAAAVAWPAPPVDEALALMRLAGRALDREGSPS